GVGGWPQSAELRVDRGANLVEGLAFLMEADGEPALALTDVTHLRHGVLPLVAGEERVEPLRRRAAALTADAVDHLGDLAHAVEQGDQTGVAAERVARGDLGGGDAGARGRVRP